MAAALKLYLFVTFHLMAVINELLNVRTRSVVCTCRCCETLRLPDKVRFQVLMVASIEMAVFWIIMPCSLVNFCRTTWCNNLGDSRHFMSGKFHILEWSASRNCVLKEISNFYSF
jgi:hypothetical protein